MVEEIPQSLELSSMTVTEVLLPTSAASPEAAGDVGLPGATPATGPVARLTGPDGETVEVPAAVYRVLRTMLSALDAGQAATISVHGTQLSTQQAADLLGVSRPTLVRLLDSGQIPSSRPNKHRRIRLEDLETYRLRRHQTRAEGLAAMVEISADLGLYDDEDLPPITR
jgi:excisionase family DNA binding protein